MVSIRHAALFAIPTALVVGLSGCSLLQPAGTDTPLSGLAACALGHTWNLDTGKLADVLKEALTKQNVMVTDVKVDGTQTLDWDLQSKAVLDTNYTITISAAPAADQVIVVTDVHKGKSTGIAYINGEVAIPRNWDASGLSIKSAAQLNGAALDPIPFTIPETDVDDSVGLEMTCDADTMTTHPRGKDVTQTWSIKG